MKKKVAIVQTSMVSTEDLKRLFGEIVPEAELINIIDDSLLNEVKRVGHITPFLVHRMCCYYQLAEQSGVDLIFNQCSSVGEAADIAAQTVATPVLKVDEPMAQKAVELGTKIAVIATVGSTMGPSCRLVERQAEKVGKKIELQRLLIDGALDVLMREGVEKHNQMVLDTVRKAAETADVIVLAQGSMIVLEPLLTDIKVPVLTSPRMGVERARELLGL